MVQVIPIWITAVAIRSSTCQRRDSAVRVVVATSGIDIHLE